MTWLLRCDVRNWGVLFLIGLNLVCGFYVGWMACRDFGRRPWP
jgi:hypothetical protein